MSEILNAGDGNFNGTVHLEVHIARHDTANAAGHTCAELHHHDQFCEDTFIMAGAGRLHPIVRATAIPGDYRQPR
ncbi:hypothetical protein [Bradyrhizobium liaoningense]|uniref:hypothetical protein n=1 Tax=Bradyrhizobium liaoningense TaxID=43992 RepID=UPI001BA8D5FA|nr:hypothetical protein [Bradyrhizobium liaoningense]MBR0986934.1 hypothetical protein [Bradyrhizobium liaoningense]